MRGREEMIAIAEAGVKRALALGADAAEVYVVQRRNTRIAAAGASVSPSESLEDALGVRVVADGRVGISGASSLVGLDLALSHALQSVRELGLRGAAAEFPAPTVDARPRATPDARLLGERAQGLADVAEALMAPMLDRPEVTYAQLTVGSFVKHIAIANSSGLAAWDVSAFERVEAEMRGTRGATERSGGDARVSAQPIEREVSAASFVLPLCDRVARALEWESPGTAAIDQAIFMGGPASQVVGMVAKSFSASSVEQDRSPFAARLGERVFAPGVELWDEPRGPAGAFWRNVDDEGTPTRETCLVRAGVLEGLVHDAQSARRAGVEPTGHGMRTGASGGVAPRPINLTMRPGDLTLDELIEGAPRAILVTEPLLGSFTANLVTGDFSVVVPFAFLVEGGRLACATPPMTLGGNAHRVLAQVEAVGKERSAYNAATVPAFRAGGVSCAS